jgi:phytoene dehydrogenase-like protein
LLDSIDDYDDLNEETFGHSARKIVGEFITDSLLVEMIFCPLMWYGNAREHDMDWGQFCIMFRSIFLEGFARPYKGVRLILKKMVRRYRELGGELKLRAGVKSIKVEDERVVGVVLDDGTELEAKKVLSSAGWIETQRLCDDIQDPPVEQAGKMTFVESISVLDKQPKELGHEDTIVFFNDSEKFNWQPAEKLCDLRTGVICSPNNFLYGDTEDGEEVQLSDGVMRITTIANFENWMNLSEEEYQLQKLRWYDQTTASAVRFVPDFRGHVVDTDFFTPKTIRRFTWHDNGAVYGAPKKRLDGKTHLKNLFICGTDQGFVGIIGSIMSGISMANAHLLRD